MPSGMLLDRFQIFLKNKIFHHFYENFLNHLKHPAEYSSRKGCEALFSFKVHDKKLPSQAHMKINRLTRKTPPMRIADVDHSDMGNTSDDSMYSEQSLIPQCSH